jgi:hypothetical protein
MDQVINQSLQGVHAWLGAGPCADRRPRIMRPNLVVTRTGGGSLHPGSIRRGAQQDLLCPTGQADRVRFPGAVFAASGSLDQLLRERHLAALRLCQDAGRRSHGHGGEISRLFDMCHGFNAALAQPALTGIDFSFAMTMRNRAFFARATNRRDRRPLPQRRGRLLPHAEVPTGWGWGLSYV